MQYECGNPSIENFISHERSAPKIKEAIDLVRNIVPLINVRYMPFCYMRGYEQYVTNYHQKKYDSFEWSNYLLQKFEQSEDRIMNTEYDPKCGDPTKLNNEIIKSVRKQYRKPFKCGACKDFLLCDGFENGYADIRDIEMEAKPDIKPTIKNPLHYRGKYDC